MDICMFLEAPATLARALHGIATFELNTLLATYIDICIFLEALAKLTRALHGTAISEQNTLLRNMHG